MEDKDVKCAPDVNPTGDAGEDLGPGTDDPGSTEVNDMAEPVTTTTTIDVTDLSKVLELVQQAVQAAQQAAQSATQTAQQVAQAVDQMSLKFAQVTGQTTGQATTAASAVNREELGDIGGTENIEANLANMSHLTMANTKRTYDLHELQMARLDNAGLMTIFNAITTTDSLAKKMVENLDAMAKQHMQHRDVAVNAHWSPVEAGAGNTLTARAVSLDDASLKAIGAAIANVISQVQPAQAGV